MEIDSVKPVQTALWTKKNPFPNLLERKLAKIKGKISQPAGNRLNFPTYNPAEKIRKIINSKTIVATYFIDFYA
ncbi:MAG: hypothetical protein Q8P15_02985 [Nanoarchaeota archaeon]|nr:hypothetical protein [Nanoarchaeota archaeon]